jgi:hypothetical protein
VAYDYYRHAIAIGFVLILGMFPSPFLRGLYMSIKREQQRNVVRELALLEGPMIRLFMSVFKSPDSYWKGYPTPTKRALSSMG